MEISCLSAGAFCRCISKIESNALSNLKQITFHVAAEYADCSVRTTVRGLQDVWGFCVSFHVWASVYGLLCMGSSLRTSVCGLQCADCRVSSLDSSIIRIRKRPAHVW